VVLASAVVLLGSAALVFYRDVRFVLPLATQLWLFASPVIYPLSVVPEALRPLYLLNPMTGTVEGFRAVLLHGRAPDLGSLGCAAVVSVTALCAAFWFFKRVEPQFADII